MSISSITASSPLTGAISLAANTSSVAQTQSPVIQAAGQTTVTLSAGSVALGASQSATSSATSDTDAAVEAQALQVGQQALQNSQLILQTGQVSMATAMNSFANDWQAEKQVIAKSRPDLLNQQWDMVTDQGTIQVTSGTLSASDKAWLTGILNQNASLVADTQAINTTLVNTFGGTADMAAKDPMGMTLTSLNQSSVDNTVHFLALLAEADTSAYNSAIIPMKQEQSYFKLSAPVGSTMNDPVVGNISSIEALQPLSAETGTRTFYQQTEVQADKSSQSGMYADTLNVAFKQFLQPALAASGSADGTDILAGMNVTANVLALLNNSPIFNGVAALWWTSSSPVGDVPCQTQAQLSATASTLSAALGSNYRNYGEASSSSGSSSLPGQTTANDNASAAVSGVGAIKSIYDGKEQSLSTVQNFIEPAMQSLDNAWTIVKAAIATKRPDLLNQKWDFVTDNGTVQATSSTLTAEQQSWLTGILNQNQNLVTSTQTINTQLVSFYKADPLDLDMDSIQSGSGQANAPLPALTQQNIDGLIPFLALMAGSDPATLIRQGLENEMAK